MFLPIINLGWISLWKNATNYLVKKESRYVNTETFLVHFSIDFFLYLAKKSPLFKHYTLVRKKASLSIDNLSID